MKKWLSIVILIIVVLFLIIPPLLDFILSFLFTTDFKVDHLSDWHKFYTNEVSYYFYIPQEAKIVFAKEYIHFPMGSSVVIKFYLPSTKLPKEWIEIIAQKSGLTSRYRINELLYEEERGDYRRIQYLPEEDLYIVEYGWD
ncbi:MAG: hypothetical protein QXT58_00665 [Archaeoglobaceae archaeon]